MVRVSVVIPVLNNVHHTRRCIESVRRNADPSKYELIIIDNGSDKAIKEYLDSLIKVKVITNKENVGFSRAVNQGIDNSVGDYVYMLNNDTILYPHWLERMVAAFDRETGAVGPVSNYVMGQQRVRVGRKSATPEQINNIISQTRKVTEAEFLIGFALMASKEAIDKVGKLDERFFAGSEDLDYSLRLRLAGYKLKVAEGVFVYHIGSRTLRDFPNAIEEGNRKFFKKWSEELDTKIVSHKQAFEIALKLPPPSLTICTIHKDEYGLLENMIKKTNMFCEDYCIIDTGSIDDSVERLNKLLLNTGCVHSYDWTGNFSDARNYALKQCRGEWILQLDADEIIEPKHTTMMRRLRERENIDAYQFKVINFRESPFLIANPKKDIFTTIRMWRNKPEIHYAGMVHETVTQSITDAGLRVAESPVPILHFAYLKPKGRHFDLMERAAKVEPKRGHNHYLLGEEYIRCGEYTKAINCFKNALACNTTKVNDRTFDSTVQQMLDITEAYSQEQGMEGFPKDIKEHFEALLKE